MKRLRLSALLFFAVFCLLIPQANASTYALDDGIGDGNFGGDVRRHNNDMDEPV